MREVKDNERLHSVIHWVTNYLKQKSDINDCLLEESFKKETKLNICKGRVMTGSSIRISHYTGDKVMWLIVEVLSLFWYIMDSSNKDIMVDCNPYGVCSKATLATFVLLVPCSI